MHLILTGATGLIGAGVLDVMLHTKEISRISILSRRPVPLADQAKDPRVNVIIHRDFEKYDASVLEQLRGATGCVWALGISQNQVNAEEYVKITKDYALSAARAFSSLPMSEAEKPFRFVYVSGEGVTHSPGRFTPIYSRVKGETEIKLADMMADMPDKLCAYSYRPMAVDPSHHDVIKPFVPRSLVFNSRNHVARLMGYLTPWMHSPTQFLGEIMTQTAMGRLDDKIEGKGAFKWGPGWIVGNVGMRRIMGI